MPKKLVSEAALIPAPGLMAMMAQLLTGDPTVDAALREKLAVLLNIATINDTVTTASYTIAKPGFVTLKLNRSTSLVLPPPVPGTGIILTLIQDGVVGGTTGGSRSIDSWGENVEWPNQGVAPILVAKPGLFNRFGLMALPGVPKWQAYIGT